MILIMLEQQKTKEHRSYELDHMSSCKTFKESGHDHDNSDNDVDNNSINH